MEIRTGLRPGRTLATRQGRTGDQAGLALRSLGKFWTRGWSHPVITRGRSKLEDNVGTIHYLGQSIIGQST